MTTRELIIEAIAINESRHIYGLAETRLNTLAADYRAAGCALSERIARRWAYVAHRAGEAELTDPKS